MPRGQSKRQARLEEEAKALQTAADKRAKQAPREGLSPDLGRGGTPSMMPKLDHHWENVKYGPRLYRDSEMVHLDPFQEPGFREFRCKHHPEVVSDPEIEVVPPNLPLYTPPPAPATRSSFVAIKDPFAVDSGLMDPMLGDQTAPKNPKVITVTSSPTPAAAEVAVADRKPTRSLVEFHVYIPKHLSDAEKRAGVATSYVDYATKEPLEELLQIHGFSLDDLKMSLYDACNDHKKPCGDLLKIADENSQMAFKGYVVHGGKFGKTALPTIPDEDTFDQFKEMLLKKEGKEVGFHLLMANPKNRARTDSRDMLFDQSLAHSHPAALDAAHHGVVEMSSIGVNAAIQAEHTNLMRQYGHTNIAGRECMGYIKPDDSTMVIYLTHSLIETWASDIVHKRYGATQISPPRRVAFKWVPIDQVKPLKGLARSNSTPSALQTSMVSHGNGLFSFNNNDSPGPRIKSNSPALGPIPDFEDYLKFCMISPEDHTTRRLLTQYDIIDFEMFESTKLTCAKMEVLGFQFGPRIRLHDKVSSYRQELKRRARGNH